MEQPTQFSAKPLSAQAQLSNQPMVMILLSMRQTPTTVKQHLAKDSPYFKIDDLKANCLLYKPDIVCIVETWLGSDVLDSEIYIPDYEFTRLDRDRHGGGVIIYVAGHLPFKVISSGLHSLEFLAISVSSPFGQFVVSVLYRPPSSPISFFDNLSLVLEDLCTPLYSHFFFYFGGF